MLRDGTLDWVKLNISVAAGVKTCALVSYFGSASAVYAAGKEAVLRSRITDRATVEAIFSADEKKALDVIAVCEKNGWHIVDRDSRFYPEALKGIKDAPFVLYCAGDPDILAKEPKISVVGTRNPTDKGLMAAYMLACCLSSLNVVTVSGGALGIDSASHEGALTGNGGTLAVLGSGLGADYLPENTFLRRRIGKNGALITEQPPFEEPTRYSFPRRNRIISALSPATVVVESGVRGGSLITADLAKRQGRRVYCFAEDIVKSPGCSELLKNGAYPFSVPGDLLTGFGFVPAEGSYDEVYMNADMHNDGIKGVHVIKPSTMTADSFAAYNGVTPDEARRVMGARLKQPAGVPVKKEKKPAEKLPSEFRPPAKKKTEAKPPVPLSPAREEKKETPPPEYLSDEAKKVLAALTDEPRYFDEIQYVTSLPAQDVMTAVTELELEDLAALHPGNRVSRI